MTVSRLRASKRALEALAALSAIVLVISGTSLARALQAKADEHPDEVAGPANADLVARCGADVVLLLDAFPVSTGDGTLAPQVAAAAQAAAAGLVGTGSHVAALAYDSEVRWLTDPSQPAPLVDAAALTPVSGAGGADAPGPLAALLGRYLTPPPTPGSPAAADDDRGDGAHGAAGSEAAATPTSPGPTDPASTGGDGAGDDAGGSTDAATGDGQPTGTTTTAPNAPQATAAPATPGRNWEAALRAAASVTAGPLGDRPTLVVHITTGAPDRHLAGPAGDQPTTAPDGANDVGRALDAAAALRARPGTHLVTVAVGEAARLGAALTDLSGPDVVTAGSTPLDVARQDVVLVPDAGSLPAVAGALTTGLCSTDVRATVVDDVDGHAGPRPSTALTLTASPPVLLAPLGAAPSTPGAASAQLTTDGDGTPTWRVQPNTSAAFGLHLAAAPDLGDLQTSLACTQTGGAAVVTAPAGDGFSLTGVQPGGTVDCELRAVQPRPAALVVHHDVVLGAGATCPDPGTAPAVIGTIDDTVVHCLTVANEGGRPLDHVAVTSPSLGIGAPPPGDSPTGGTAPDPGDDWRLDGLAPGEVATRRVERPLDGLVSATTTATADDAGEPQRADAAVVVQVRPASLAVARVLAGADDPGCRSPLAAPSTGQAVSWCATVTNTGGTYLADITVNDPALGPDPLTVPGRLAPGTATTVSAAGVLNGDPAATPVARATAVNRAGEPLGDPGAVTSARADDPGLHAEGQVSATRVKAGDAVTMSVAVTNSSPDPLTDVRVESSTCGPVDQPSAEVGGNGDTRLQAGETWLYVCSAPVYAETLAVASVVTPAQSTETQPTRVKPMFPDLRVTMSQKNDLRVGSQTTYELKVQNVGDLDAAGVVVTDTLDPGMQFVSASWRTVVPPSGDDRSGETSYGPSSPCQASGQTVTCQLGTMAAQDGLEHILVTLVVGVDPATVNQILTNTVNVATSTAGDSPIGNTDAKRGKVFAAGDCANSRDCDPSVDQPGNDLGASGDGGGSFDPNDPFGVAGTEVRAALATTGVDTQKALAWGLVLVAAGMTLVAAGRRRHLLG